MVEVFKLNDTIGELEKQVENIRSISTIITELDNLKDEIKHNKLQYEDSIKKLDSAKNSLDNSTNMYQDNIKEFRKTMLEIEKDLNNKMNDIANEHLNFSRELTYKYQKLEEEILTQIQTIRNENKKLYLEFEEILSSKLERNKSDIEVEVRNSTKEIKSSLENTFNSNLSILEKVIIDKSAEQDKRFKNTNISIIVVGVLTIINIILSYMRS